MAERGHKMERPELRRTKKRLSEKEGSVPAVVFKRKRKHRMTGRSITMSDAELTGQKPNFGLPIVDERRKRKGGWKKVDKAPVLKKDVEDSFKITNGVDIPIWVTLIKQVEDVKVAKKIARMAGSWYKKLYGLEEIRMVKEFKVGDDVWWRKNKVVHAGRVFRLKSRKLVIDTEPWDPNEERVVLPVRKAIKGTVPKEYIQPDSKRWGVGRARKKGGETKLAEAVAL